MNKIRLSLFFFCGFSCSYLAEPQEAPAPLPLRISQPAATQASSVPFCGNGKRDLIPGEHQALDKVEECDSPTRGCNLQYCVFSQCGDGVLDPGETCDDHNLIPGDGCSIRC